MYTDDRPDSCQPEPGVFAQIRELSFDRDQEEEADHIGVFLMAFAGYDPGIEDPTKAGRIFSYDVTGGRYEEHSFHSVGSGSVFARGALKKLYREDFSEADAVTACIQALYDAADDDSATGGPDLTRRIFPVVASVTADGFRKLPEDEVGQVTQRVVDERMSSPGGPIAPLGGAN